MSTTPPTPPPPPPPPPPGSYPPGSYPSGSYPSGPSNQTGMGTASLVLGILSFFVCPIIFSVAAILTGIQGEKLAAQGLANNGETARWGKILGIVSLVAYGVVAIFFFFSGYF